VVTFLLTDIEGSTRRWESDADGMRLALADHDDVLRAAIEAHGGFLFKHTGDGVVAAFASPKAAVDAATDAQRNLQLPVRMGLATGEATMQDGDYFGAVLNRAARVMAAGHGGQILVADSTAALLSGVDLLELGPRRLRDVPTPIGLYQLRAHGLREHFPPLRALDTSRGNLRSATTSFIGRDSEVDGVVTAVRAHRFVTLTGVGGVGKTRLALEVATQISDEFPDGIWLFELATVTDPAAVTDAVATTLGITQQPDKTLAESVATALEGRHRLLLFDNCEHVLEAVADLTETLLKRSATVRVLATSREGLGVADEQVWRVRSLDTGAAIELFIERACSVTQGFSVDEPYAVREICRRLDGIPLAIELAASRMASMTASEVRDRLDQRFRLLVGSRRGLERHQTLRHAVQWSYDLLTEPEKRLLETCSVFAGGFDIKSACAVACSDDEFATLNLVDALVRKSLVIAERASGHTRYSMLETIRQFAEEQLAARGDADTARTAHASFFAQRAAHATDIWAGPRQKDAYDWYATEMANLRTAFRWATDRGDLDVAAAIVARAGWFGTTVENFEPVAWAEELVEPTRVAGHSGYVSMCAIASLCYMLGRSTDAVAYSEAAQRVIADDSIPFSYEQLWLGAVYSAVEESERYIEFYRGQLARTHDGLHLAKACLVVALLNSARFEEGYTTSDELVEAAEATRNPYAISFALLVRGMAQSRFDPAGAVHTLRRGLDIAKDSGNRANVSYLAMSLAMTLNRADDESDDPAAALDNVALAVGNYFESGNITQMRAALGIFMKFLDRRGYHEPAAVVAGFASVAPTAARSLPEFDAAVEHLREVLGEQTFAALARRGADMTMAGAVEYAHDQMDRVRHDLDQLP
jgi:predicted ATPase